MSKITKGPLKEIPPRKTLWFTREGRELKNDPATHWIAILGVVDKVSISEDSDGTDYIVKYSYQLNDSNYQSSLTVGYDLLHWGMSYPEHKEWFEAQMREGQLIELLINPSDCEDSVIFGQLELFIKDQTHLKFAASVVINE